MSHPRLGSGLEGGMRTNNVKQNIKKESEKCYTLKALEIDRTGKKPNRCLHITC